MKSTIKNVIIVIGCIALILLGIAIIFYGIHKKEEEFNNESKKICLETIEKRDFSVFKKYIETLKNSNQKENVYQKLEEEFKANANSIINDYEKSLEMSKAIKEELTTNKKNNEERLNNVLEIGQNLYTYNICLINGEKNIEKGNYYSAYKVFETAKNCIKDIDNEKSNAMAAKQKEIYDKSKEDAKEFLIDKINSSEIDNNISYSLVKGYIDIVKDEELIKLYNEWNEKNETLKKEKQAIEKQKEKERKKQEGVRIGMSKQDVLDSMWGEPIKINNTVTRYGTHEQWVYPNNNYLYFENGKLTSIQN